MRGLSHGLNDAAREHLASGEPLTRLEAMILYGIANLPDTIKELRKEGWIIKSRLIPYATAVTRVNRYAVLQPPRNLPIAQIQLTEYWVSR